MRVVKHTPDTWPTYHFSLYISGRCHPDNNLFYRLQQLLRGTEILTQRHFWMQTIHALCRHRPTKTLYFQVWNGIHVWKVTLAKIT